MFHRMQAGNHNVALSRHIPQVRDNQAIRDYVDSLPKPIIDCWDLDNHTCPICREEYHCTPLAIAKEPAVELECGHTMGQNCVLEWIMKDAYPQAASCPLCRKTILPCNIFNRADSLRRYLLWLMRTYPLSIGRGFFKDLEDLQYEILRKALFAAEDQGNTKRYQRIKGMMECKKAAYRVRASRAYWQEHQRNIRGAGVPIKISHNQWVTAAKYHASAQCILHYMSEETLKGFAGSYVNLETLAIYEADKEYGPSGDREDWDRLPWDSLQDLERFVRRFDNNERQQAVDRWPWNYPIEEPYHVDRQGRPAKHWSELGIDEY